VTGRSGQTLLTLLSPSPSPSHCCPVQRWSGLCICVCPRVAWRPAISFAHFIMKTLHRASGIFMNRACHPVALRFVRSAFRNLQLGSRPSAAPCSLRDLLHDFRPSPCSFHFAGPVLSHSDLAVIIITTQQQPASRTKGPHKMHCFFGTIFNKPLAALELVTPSPRLDADGKIKGESPAHIHFVRFFLVQGNSNA
jgi:hypothetical protein